MNHLGEIIAFEKLTIINSGLLLGEFNIMQSLKIVLPIALAVFLIFTTFQPEASTYFVDKSNPNASDNNLGTENAPWKTIQRGVDIAQAGDTVYVKYAIYNEDITMVNSGNAMAGHISFIGLGEEMPVIDGNGKSSKLINWHGTPDGGIQKNYIAFIGIEIRNATKWAIWMQGDYNIIKNCKIYNSGHTAIQIITGSHNNINNNEIYNTGWNAISWESNNGNSGILTDYNIIEHNYIHDIPNHVAINGFPNEGAGNWNQYGGLGNVIRFNKVQNCLEGFYFRYEKDMEIYGNILWDIFGYQGIHFHVTSGDNSSTYESNSKIYNNIIAYCQQNGIFNTNAKNLDIMNNIFYMNSNENNFYNIEFKSRTQSTGNHLENNIYFGGSQSQKQINLYGTKYTIQEIQTIGMELNGYYTNPLFTDEANGNYKPQNNSPAVDAGFNLGSPFNVDIDGVIRPQGAAYDIGAYEIITGPDIYPPEVIGAALIDSVTLSISFSEPLELNSAQDPNNYSIIGNVSIFSASLSGSNVILNTSSHSPGIYTVTVSNVTDLAGNIISSSANSAQYEFVEDPQTELIQLQIVNVTASVIPEPEHSPEKTIDGLGYGDGDPDSRWAGEPMPEWLMFDLGTIKSVGMTKLSFFNWDNGRIYNYNIEVSTDMNQWQGIVSNTTSLTEEWSVEEFEPVDARYIKIIFINSNQNQWAGLWEGQVWGYSPTSIDDELQPEGIKLDQNYPNPFNPSTTIRYSLAESQNVILGIYNTLGQLVNTLVEKFQSKGTHEIVFDAKDLASGIYIYRLQTGSYSDVRKMILQK